MEKLRQGFWPVTWNIVATILYATIVLAMWSLVKPFIPQGWSVSVAAGILLVALGLVLWVYNEYAQYRDRVRKEKLKARPLVVKATLEKWLRAGGYQVGDLLGADRFDDSEWGLRVTDYPQGREVRVTQIRNRHWVDVVSTIPVPSALVDSGIPFDIGVDMVRLGVGVKTRDDLLPNYVFQINIEVYIDEAFTEGNFMRNIFLMRRAKGLAQKLIDRATLQRGTQQPPAAQPPTGGP